MRYDFVLEEHRVALEYAWSGSHYVVRCVCGWMAQPEPKFVAIRLGHFHLEERARALEAAREKTRYLIFEEP